MAFVHLHVHSHLSLLDGVLRHDEIAGFAAEHGMPAVALTDHGNLFGVVDFLKACDDHDIKGIIGCELYITPGNRFEQTREAGLFHITALAMNDLGYKNLIKLVSLAFLEGFYYKPRIDFDLLERYHEGLVLLSGCLQGQVPFLLRMGREDEAVQAAKRYRDIVGKENFFLEIMNHGLEDEKKVLPMLVDLARTHDFPLVATNDVHYLRPSDAHLQDILLCISTGKKLSDEHRMKFENTEFTMKTEKEMREAFSGLEDALDNTVKIADRVHFRLKRDQYFLPHFEIPDGYSSINHYFEQRCREGLKERLARPVKRTHPDEVYKKRLDEELKTILSMNFPGYFLIVSDIINHAKTHDIPVGPGRGSAAGSLVSYSLKITDIDPLEYSLLFERFLNKDRISLPDIDVDFSHTGRGKVLDYIRYKFGEQNVAQIVTFNTLKAKSVIQDVARVIGLDFQETLTITKELAFNMSLKESLENKNNPTFKQMVEASPRLKEIVDFGIRLEGNARNISVHAAGVVITPDEVTNYVPLARTPKGETVTQYDKDRLEELGLLKMDILGLRTLTVIQDTIRSIRLTRGETIDLDTLTYDDPAVFELFGRGETDGVFQFESDGMKKILRQTKPDRIEDLVALNALYRPGAIQSNMVEEFIQRKRGLKPVEYLTPELKELLSETYGIIVYQEQVMQIAVRIAGFTMSQADNLRKAMGKKKKEIMEKEREPFIQGCVKQKFNKKMAGEIFDFIAPFAGYGFNKSHSVAYAVLAYQTAYLKTHYPTHYMAALLTSEIHDTKKVSQYIAECSRMGIALLPPDINESEVEFSVVGTDIRFGLEAIKGVGNAAAEDFVTIRQTHGRFKSMVDFVSCFTTQTLNRKSMEALTYAGAFDSIQENRAYLFHHLDRFMNLGSKLKEDRLSGQKSLFGEAALLSDDPPLEPVEPWSRHEMLKYELESTGIYLSGHPLEAFRQDLHKYSDVDLDELPNCGGRTVQVGGMIQDMQTLQVKAGPNAGKLWARFTLEGLSSSVPCLVFADAFTRLGSQLKEQSDQPVIVKALVKVEEQRSSLLVDDIYTLADAPMRHARELLVLLSEPLDRDLLEEVREVIFQNRGELPVRFIVERPGAYRVTVEPGISYRVDPSSGIMDNLETLLGQNTCRYLF
ncbi:MAG TPA: DNA polymerase III subunit alpha [Thermoanaerobaculia bacterium]|nr:DNA polymerase III subunit alpha [Thermoanaerobaculia bacterium]HXK69231.1 DNA polymerase III subunit alpha [Thermoanaerobaculia bacterium]